MTKRITPPTRMARPMTPPTTPPAMAPVFDEPPSSWDDEVEDGTEVLVVVGSVSEVTSGSSKIVRIRAYCTRTTYLYLGWQPQS